MKRSATASVKTTTFDKPPAGFDLDQAKEKDLLRYGLPIAPMDRGGKRHYAKFFRDFIDKFEHIKPKFEIRERTGLRRKQKKPRVVSEGLDNTAGWSGGEVNFVGEGGFTYVTGEFTVPNVTAPLEKFQYQHWSSHWIGIGQANILQAGVECDVLRKGKNGTKFDRDIYAWWQFANSEPLVKITNFQVSPGDLVGVFIIPDNAGGLSQIYLTNSITGVATSLGVNLPSRLDVSWAEWISEMPEVGGVVYTPALANFGQVFYSNCIAGTLQGGMPVSQGNSVNMLADINDPTSVVCEGVLEGEFVCRAIYLGP